MLLPNFMSSYDNRLLDMVKPGLTFFGHLGAENTKVPRKTYKVDIVKLFGFLFTILASTEQFVWPLNVNWFFISSTKGNKC